MFLSSYGKINTDIAELSIFTFIHILLGTGTMTIVTITTNYSSKKKHWIVNHILHNLLLVIYRLNSFVFHNTYF